MSQANMGLGILQETKITDNIFTCRSAEYSIVALDKPSKYRGELLLFHQLAQNFSVEAIQKFGPNAVGFHLVTGERRWYIMGCYLTPNNTSTI